VPGALVPGALCARSFCARSTALFSSFNCHHRAKKNIFEKKKKKKLKIKKRAQEKKEKRVGWHKTTWHKGPGTMDVAQGQN
jgi:hypothetical protein